MARSTFSGWDVAKVLVNKGNFTWVRTRGDHARLTYTHPTNQDDVRHVSVPLHDELRPGTLRDIATDAGAKDFDRFCRWIDRNR